MSMLEEINQMKKQGMSDEDITNFLKEKGVSPKEINDSFSKAKIKSAISPEEYYEPMSGEEIKEGYVTPQSQEVQEQQTYTPQEYPQEQYQQAYAPQENYEGSYSPGGIDTDTIIEVAEQVFQDKIKIIQKQVEGFNEFKTLLQSNINNLSERLKRIETVMDKLQNAILEKVGSYGENLESIRKEMGMMQDSFGKIVSNVAEKKSKPALDDIFQEPKNPKFQQTKSSSVKPTKNKF